jgi:signal transduction histidine kinase
VLLSRGAVRDFPTRCQGPIGADLHFFATSWRAGARHLLMPDPGALSLFIRLRYTCLAMTKRTGSLRKRITLTILTGISIILLTFSIASYYIVEKNIENSHNEKLAFARLIGNNVDNIIQDNINRLYDISISGKINLHDNDFGPERDALRTAYRYSIFTDGVFLLDTGGNIILNYPAKIRDSTINVLSIEPISRIVANNRPVVSSIYTLEPSGRKVMFVLVPLKDKHGNTAGVAGGEIDPTNPVLTRMLGLTHMGKNMFIDIVDLNGVIISSSDHTRILTQCNRDGFFSTIISEKQERVTTCHRCHVAGNMNRKQTMILAFVPLEMAPWGISIQEPEEDVFTPASRLKWTFFTLAVIFIGTAFILTIGISRSIVDPLKDLIQGTDRIAKEDLSKPIPFQGTDEIGILSQSFESMRLKLVESRERIRKHAQELESRVRQRTCQINESQKRAEVLLKKIISSQEDERRRIGRELHDDTLQELSAALMRIDLCRLHPQEITIEKVNTIRQIIGHALEGVIGIIQNMRPTLLDDLGLVAAIKSILALHLGEKGINYFINTSRMGDQRFRPELEITLFRIIQEAVVNIARHANSESAFILFKIENSTVYVEIEDDGEGFDLNSLFLAGEHEAKDRRGLGLLGMKERVTLIGGKIEVCSSPGNGTRVDIRIPLREAEEVGRA